MPLGRLSSLTDLVDDDEEKQLRAPVEIDSSTAWINFSIFEVIISIT